MNSDWIGMALNECHALDWSQSNPLGLHSIRRDWMTLDWIGLIRIALDSNESNRMELNWIGLDPIHWMLFHLGLAEFPIVGFLQVEIPTSYSFSSNVSTGNRSNFSCCLAKSFRRPLY